MRQSRPGPVPEGEQKLTPSPPPVPSQGGSIPHTLAYNTLLEVALSMQGFQRRQLYMEGPWNWLLNEFSTAFGVSDAYKNLR